RASLFERKARGAPFRNVSGPRHVSAPCRAFNPRCMPRYNRRPRRRPRNSRRRHRSQAKRSAMGSARRARFFFALPAPLALPACGGGAAPDTGAASGGQATPSTGAAGRAAVTATATLPERFGNVTRERLLAADSEPGNWFTEGRDFGKSFYSPLEQINLGNIGRLGFAWEYRTGTTRGMEATPVVIDGVLYAAGPTGRVYAVNAATGEELWKFDPQSDGQVNRYACCDEVNRGLAVW